MSSNTVSEIMTRNVECVSPSQKIIDVKHIYEKKDFHHHIPVVENDMIVGMVSLIDFMRNINNAGLDDDTPIYSELTVNDIMSTDPFFLSPSASIQEVARILAKGEFHAVPVVVEGKVVGIVSTADVIRFYLDE
ncbi:MAG: CBS domain-containing protein [Flavobacteriales bacterium]|nr:CBS domain-containing protein [Flavobacteriales bacterium]